VKNKISKLIIFLFLVHCGTSVPIERKVTKVENIKGKEVEVYLQEKSEKTKTYLIFKEFEDQGKYQFKIRDEFKIPQVLMREDIAKKYIVEKKRATMVHNPLGEGTTSIFALGMIEAWCLTEWLGTALPGRQKNIYLSKCKERYIGSKRKYTQEDKTQTIIKETGKFKNEYQDLTRELVYSFNDDLNKEFKMDLKVDTGCKNDKLKEFDCGTHYDVSLQDFVSNYIKTYGDQNIKYPIKVNVQAENNKEVLIILESKVKDRIELALKQIAEDKEKYRLEKIEEQKKQEAKNLREENERIKEEKKLAEINKPIPYSNGTAFYVSRDGYLVTNNHVVEDTSVSSIDSTCDKIYVFNGEDEYEARIISQDRQNDLALLKTVKETNIRNYSTLRSSEPILGEQIVAMGYPFGKSISSKIKLTTGNVSSLSGLGDEFTRIQIDAALQPGNSGGPIYDKSGNVIAVAVAKASIEFFLENFGTLPENMNFGIKTSVLKSFLEANKVSFKSSGSGRTLSIETIAEYGEKETLYLECHMRKDKASKIAKIRKKNL
jgi:hypothetical protein